MNTSNITNYKPKDFAELVGVSVKTLQRWDREGILKSNRTPTNRRYYTYDQYLQFKGINVETDSRQLVIYARVSTSIIHANWRHVSRRINFHSARRRNEAMRWHRRLTTTQQMEI